MAKLYQHAPIKGPGPQTPTPNQVTRLTPTAGSVFRGTNVSTGILGRIGASFTGAFRK